MREHRNAQGRIANKPQLDNFNPADALERLHTELVQLEVFAHAAGEAVTRLRRPSNRAARREFVRVYALVSKVADDAVAAVALGDGLIAELGRYLQRRASAAS
jgi:hypothetical protein